MGYTQPKEAVLTRLDPEVVKRVDRIAKDRDWTRSQTVQRLVEKGIEAEALGGLA